MRGVFAGYVGLFCVLFFSLLLFVSDSLQFFWLFLELSTLSLIPVFFLQSGSNLFTALFNYVVVCAVSSALIISGFLFQEYIILTYVGFFMKLGIFPFFGWVYLVINSSNWVVIWGLSTFLKLSFLFFSFFMSSGNSAFGFLNLCCALTFVFVGVLFWVCTYSWNYYWCHIVVTSSAVLLAMSVESSFRLLWVLFCSYVVWSSLCILVLNRVGSSGLSGGFSYFLFLSLLVSFPFSIAIFYKLFIGFCVFSCGLMVFCSWVIYSISEQAYLLKYLISEGTPGLDWGGVTLI